MRRFARPVLVATSILTAASLAFIVNATFSTDQEPWPGPLRWIQVHPWYALLALTLVAAANALVINRETQSPAGEGYANRVNKLVGQLAETSNEVDTLLKEMQNVALRRQESLAQQEDALERLAKEQEEKKKTIQALSKSSPETVTELMELLDKQQRAAAKEAARSRARDYGLFLAGNVTTAIAAVVLHGLNFT